MDRPTAAALLSHSFLRTVFDRVIDARSVKLRDLAQPGSRKDVSEALKQLTAAGLVAEKPEPIEDRNTYYATAKGLGAQRLLRQIDSKFDQL